MTKIIDIMPYEKRSKHTDRGCCAGYGHRGQYHPLSGKPLSLRIAGAVTEIILSLGLGALLLGFVLVMLTLQ